MTVLSKSKSIRHLTFIESDGVTRAKGRLREADVENQTNYPIILRSQYWAVNLFLEKIQKRWHHEGVEFLRGVTSQNFWMPGLRNAL